MNSGTPYCYAHPHPAVTTDVATFCIRDGDLKLLLIRRAQPPFQGMWALPGGFVEIDEDIDDGARRELAEETGLTGLYLEQLRTFGQPGRDPRERVISVAYLALVPRNLTTVPRAGSDAAEAGWFDVDRLPPLAFDHAEIIATARKRLCDKLDYSTIGFQFVAETFTLGELQAVYEAVQGRPLDKRNFRKRLLAQGQIEETGQTRRNGRHRPAREYRTKHPHRVEYIK